MIWLDYVRPHSVHRMINTRHGTKHYMLNSCLFNYYTLRAFANVNNNVVNKFNNRQVTELVS